MKKIIATTFAAALLASTSVGAFAQDAGVGVDADAEGGVSVETPAGDVGVDAGADASAGASVDTGEHSYDSVIASIQGSSAVDLSAVTDEASVTIVLLSSLEGEASALDQALTEHEADLATLHSSIEANAAITAKLEAEGHDVEDVVAVQSQADGSVVVFVDDRA
jgi:hypothetical protein